LYTSVTLAEEEDFWNMGLRGLSWWCRCGMDSLSRQRTSTVCAAEYSLWAKWIPARMIAFSAKEKRRVPKRM